MRAILRPGLARRLSSSSSASSAPGLARERPAIIPMRAMTSTAPSPASGTTLTAQSETIPGLKQCLTATNLAEILDNTHALPAGTLVQVFAIYGRGPGITQLLRFQSRAARAVVVSISGNAAGGGIRRPNPRRRSSASPGSGLSMPAGLTPGDNVLILNVEETGMAGHRIAGGSYAVGVVRGRTSETPPRRSSSSAAPWEEPTAPQAWAAAD